MIKNKVVLFNANGLGARVFINPEAVPHGALVNPDLKPVDGVSPSFWKFENGSILPMTKEERETTQGLQDSAEFLASEKGIKALKEIEKKLAAHEKSLHIIHEHLSECDKGLYKINEKLSVASRYTASFAIQHARQMADIEGRFLKTFWFLGITFAIIFWGFAWLLK